MSDDDRATLLAYARVDWVYTDRPTVLHALGAGQPDPDHWRFEDVTFACGRKPKDGLAWIPGIFSRMGMKRCDRCCDATDLPRGKGSPKNDNACRELLGLPPSPRLEENRT